MLWVGLAVVVVLGGVAIGAFLATGGSSNTGAHSAPPPPSTQPTVFPVTQLTADAEPFAVTLSWTPATGGSRVEGYTIYRNGASLGNVLRGLRSFTDEYAIPGKRYTYEVVARGAGGLESSRVSVSVKVPVPPISRARVEGDFSVKLRLVSQSGFQELRARSTEAWSFKPRCDEGPCPVVWTDLSLRGFKTTLKRAGGKYSGSDNGRFGSCSGVVGTATLTVELRVVKARAFSGEWVATKLVGTVRESSPEQLGCVGSTALFNVVATLAQ